MNCNCHLPPSSLGLWGVARAHTSATASPETLLLLQQVELCALQSAQWQWREAPGHSQESEAAITAVLSSRRVAWCPRQGWQKPQLD
jgi:hypothetical protein